MFDSRLRPRIDPPLDRAARALVAAGLTADQITAAGLILGLGAAGAIAFEAYGIALVLIVLNRLADGLDGAVARATRPSDLGGFLDIVFDFAVYAAVPLGFVVAAPAENAVAGAVLLASFYLNGTAFLAFAALAARRGWETAVQGRKSIYYLSGLAEGAETIAAFVLMCLFPSAFAPIAYVFAALCFASGAARIAGVVLKRPGGGG